MKNVSIVMVNWNGKKMLKDCLKRVFNQTYKDFDVILVDNGSTDGSVDMVRQEYPTVELIINKENMGVAQAQDIGFRAAKGKYIVSLHNDTLPDKMWLERFVKTMDTGKAVCIEGDVVHFDGVGVINGSLNVLCYNTLDVFDDPKKKFYSGTCSMIMKNDLMKKYFDHEYFFYGEDVYLGWKLRLMGHNIIREPSAKVMHYGTQSVMDKKTKNLFYFYNERHRLMNFLMFYEVKNIMKLLPLNCVITSMYILKNIFTDSDRAYSQIKAVFWVVKNRKRIFKKRSEIQKLRKVSDENITPMLSSRVFPGTSKASQKLNSIAKCYCSTIGIKTAEV
ncbi:MAG: glycosyltransferase family 2 protein [Candidatus Aenigmatarchaeota archaeon]